MNSFLTGTIDVNNNGANTGNTVVFTSAIWGATNTLNVTGGNGYKLQLTNLSFAGGIGAIILNPTTVPLTLGTATSTTGTWAHLLQLDGTNTSNAFTGAVSDGLSVTTVMKAGTGTWTLNGANTYTGTTTVSAGTLKIGTGGSLGNTALSVASGATFAPNPVGGSMNAGTAVAGTVGATLSLVSGSIFSMTNAAVGTFNLQQNASFAATALTISGATMNMDLSSGVNSIDITTVGSSLTVGSYSIITASSGLNAGTWQFVGGGTTKAVTVGL